MNHWTEKYIGRRYDKDTYNCAHFVGDVARTELGIDVALPDDQEWRGKAPSRVVELGIDYADEVDVPQEFDIVLMELAGRKRSVGSHIGIHVNVSGTPWVLHNIQGANVTLVAEHGLTRYFLKVIGYYRWKPQTP